MWNQKRAWFMTIVMAIGAALPCHQTQASSGDYSMKEHMEIQATIANEPELGKWPSVMIDRIQSAVPLDDRLDADAPFSAPFVDSLRQGMGWYLNQRGMRIVNEGADLRLAGTIESYEGWKGWGHWGVDVHLRVKLFRGSELVFNEDLRSFLKYSDDHTIAAEERPKYRARQGNVRFLEVLFTRVGIDFSEKLIATLKEKTASLSPSAQSAAPQAVSASSERGRLTIEASVALAEVFLDGRLLGTTPLQDLQIPAKAYSIEVRKKGFKPWKREIIVLEGTTSRITAELETEDTPPR